VVLDTDIYIYIYISLYPVPQYDGLRGIKELHCLMEIHTHTHTHTNAHVMYNALNCISQTVAQLEPKYVEEGLV
jgi:hypothetical protein